MKVAIAAVLVVVVFSACALAQAKPVYKVGTITDIAVHKLPSGEEAVPKSYEITVKVGDFVYVVLFTPAGDPDVIEYKKGLDTTVLVEGDVMKANDIKGRTHKVPIISRTEVVTDKGK